MVEKTKTLVPPTMTRHHITIDGLHLSYLEQGTPDATQPSILILHGLIAAAETFNTFAAHLPRRHIIALDMPGNGESAPAANADFASLAILIKDFAAAIDLKTPILLGHSHGGVVALRLAADAPESFSALILLCPAHPFSRQEDALVRFYLSRAGRLFARAIPRLPTHMLRLAFDNMPGKPWYLHEPELEPYLRALRRPELIANTLAMLSTWNADMRSLAHDLEQHPLPTPTLLLWGEKDIVVPPSTAGLLRQYLINTELAILDGVGHLPNHEAPAECARLISAWLASHDRSVGR